MDEDVPDSVNQLKDGKIPPVEAGIKCDTE
jgi:hypothetical protein